MKRVLLLLCEGTEIFEAAAFYDVLGWSGSVGRESVAVATAALRSPVTCAFGLRVLPDLRLTEVDAGQFDALAVPGGFEEFGFYEDAFSDEAARLIQSFGGLGKPVASICVGALPVARSGLLAGRRATTYHLEGGRREQLAGFGVRVIDAPLVREGNVTTSTSPATAAEVALSLLEDLTGRENADLVRRLMGFGG